MGVLGVTAIRETVLSHNNSRVQPLNNCWCVARIISAGLGSWTRAWNLGLSWISLYVITHGVWSAVVHHVAKCKKKWEIAYESGKGKNVVTNIRNVSQTKKSIQNVDQEPPIKLYLQTMRIFGYLVFIPNQKYWNSKHLFIILPTKMTEIPNKSDV